MLGIQRVNTNDTIITVPPTDLSLPVNEEDVLCFLVVLGAAEAPLDVHLCPLLVKLFAGPSAAGASSRRGSDVASAAPEIRRSQHDLHLVPLHPNWSSSSSTQWLEARRQLTSGETLTEVWKVCYGSQQYQPRPPPATAQPSPATEKYLTRTKKSPSLLLPPASCLLSPVPCPLSPGPLPLAYLHI